MKLSTLVKPMQKFAFAAFAATCLVSAAAADNNGNGNGNGKAPGAHGQGNGKNLVQNGRSELKGNLKTLQHIYYVGDELELSVQFARGHQLLEDGEADAHVVVFSQSESLIVVPVPDDVGPAARKFYQLDSVDISTLPEGQYQLGLVVTVPDGDPTLLEDWYGGFRALLDTEAVYIAAAPIDTDDDQDGEHDDDEDGDGIDGEEDDETDDDEDTTAE